MSLVQEKSEASQLAPVTGAPGCFGSPSVFGLDSKACLACDFYTPCRPASYESLARIRKIINVKDIIDRHEKARLKAKEDAKLRVAEAAAKVTSAAAAAKAAGKRAPNKITQPEPITEQVERKTSVGKVVFDATSGQESIISGMPVKTAELARQQIKNNRLSSIRSDLHAGNNPYGQTGPKYLRLACDMLLNGGFTRSSLTKNMMTQFGWAETTARPHVSQVCGLFGHFSITQEIDGLFTQNPESA